MTDRGRVRRVTGRAEAERYLLSLELFGMRFGLDRMRRLMTALGHPERQFESIHVVGTNGKSSTVADDRRDPRPPRAARPAPTCRRTWSRSASGSGSTTRDLEPAAFAAAVARAARAAELVDRVGGGEDPVTQFEALTAAAYSELARREVEVAVIEAGLGGRYDATNVIPSKVQVLTSVGLEHTRWLGSDADRHRRREARRSSRTARRSCSAPAWTRTSERVAERVAAERGARIVHAGVDPGVEVGAPGTFQRRNFALARAAAEAFLGRLDERTRWPPPAPTCAFPGRLQQVGGRAADAARRRAQPGRHAGAGRVAAASSPARAGDRVVAVVSILDDKDAAGMLAALLPACDAVVFTSSQNPRALPPPTLQSLATPARRPTERDRPRPGPRARARRASWPVRRES